MQKTLLIYELATSALDASHLASRISHALKVWDAFEHTAGEEWDFRILINRWNEALDSPETYHPKLLGGLETVGYDGPADRTDINFGGASAALVIWLEGQQNYPVLAFSYSLSNYHFSHLSKLPIDGRLVVLPYGTNTEGLVNPSEDRNFSTLIHVGGGEQQNIQQWGRGIEAFDFCEGVDSLNTVEKGQVSNTSPYVAGKLVKFLEDDYSPEKIKKLLWKSLPNYPTWNIRNGFGKVPANVEDISVDDFVLPPMAFITPELNAFIPRIDIKAGHWPDQQIRIIVNDTWYADVNASQRHAAISQWQRPWPDELSGSFRFSQIGTANQFPFPFTGAVKIAIGAVDSCGNESEFYDFNTFFLELDEENPAPDTEGFWQLYSSLSENEPIYHVKQASTMTSAFLLYDNQFLTTGGQFLTMGRPQLPNPSACEETPRYVDCVRRGQELVFIIELIVDPEGIAKPLPVDLYDDIIFAFARYKNSDAEVTASLSNGRVKKLNDNTITVTLPQQETARIDSQQNGTVWFIQKTADPENPDGPPLEIRQPYFDIALKIDPATLWKK